ncbi:Integral inner nuclear membrane protein ima1 [Hypsizygus marmoreus]|uniref:Integral inner nuclear membrane protein ima1 n=1 Tax=Hypsizygus marmoreus TaxID=39966 RepID=A0A369KAH5_HYPMA|nr:Integral inner nuclear membrane protein ima1 [Hypsizygus marmoreus]
MPTLFRRHSNVSCFFCQSPCGLPATPNHFRCPTCGCWNRFDANGDIISEEPAMHVESLNSKSFAMRATTSQDQLPTMYGKGPFCHTCQSNQLLLINLLSNYLPSPNDPEYAVRLAMLPEYRESLQLRYPPVCDSCLPAVEDEIQKKDHMARTLALGGWLNESKGKERQRRISDVHREKEKVSTEIIAWRIRGVLWALSLCAAILGNAIAALGYQPWSRLPAIQPLLPVIVLISLVWTVWDPTYSSFRRSQRQGRDVRVRGKPTYIVRFMFRMQMLAWISRLTTSILLALAWNSPHKDYICLHNPSYPHRRLYFLFSLVLEAMAFLVSCAVIRLHRPPAVRLLNTSSHKMSLSRSSTPTPATRLTTPAIGPPEPDLLATLSLSSKPIITPTNPVFGLPSLLSSVPSTSATQECDVDAMDWTPTDGAGSNSENDRQRLSRQVDDGSWLRPQRFFAPEKPTGLEGLFERTLVVDDVPRMPHNRSHQSGRPVVLKHLSKWWGVYLILLVPLGGILYTAWVGTRRHISHPEFGPGVALI